MREMCVGSGGHGKYAENVSSDIKKILPAGLVSFWFWSVDILFWDVNWKKIHSKNKCAN